MVNEHDPNQRQQSPLERAMAASDEPAKPGSPSASSSNTAPAIAADAIIFKNSRGLAGAIRQQANATHLHHSKLGNGHKPSAASRKALTDPKILDCVLRHLWDECLVYGREARQAYLRNLTVVAKDWVEPVSQWLWMNPYFGTARRAASLEQCLRRSPKRGLHIRKLIFGEGSSTDIMDWVTKHNVPNLLRAAPNVQVVGMGGLQNVHLNDYKAALHTRAMLEEVRACDLMPEPWCYVDSFFDEVLGPCKMLSRLRMYNLYTDVHHAKPLEQRLTQVAFNHCAINSIGLKNIFASSTHSLERLHIEYPMDLNDAELLLTLKHLGPGLRELTVQGFGAQMEDRDPPSVNSLVDQILEACPNLAILNFPEAIASVDVFDTLIGSKLKLWSFSCGSDVRPEHWLKAFTNERFPRPANCRMYTTGWSQSDVRKVRIRAFSIGVNWLLSGGV